MKQMQIDQWIIIQSMIGYLIVTVWQLIEEKSEVNYR